MKVYIVLEDGYEDGSEIDSVFRNSNDAIDRIKELRRNQDPLDDWLSFRIEEKEIY